MISYSDVNYRYYLQIRLLNLSDVPRTVGEITVGEPDEYGFLPIGIAGIKQADGMPAEELIKGVHACVEWLEGKNPDGNPFGDEAMRTGSDYWSGWFFSSNSKRFYQRVFTGNEIAYPYRRSVRGQWEWMWNADKPDCDSSDEFYEPDKWELVDDSKLAVLLDKMEAAVKHSLLELGPTASTTAAR